MINLDNAATSGKKPESVIRAVTNALYKYSANPGRGGHNLSISTAEAIYNAREKISEYFGASGGDRVIFTSNCTTAINYVLKCFLKKEDHVIISDLEHNAVLRPIEKMGIKRSLAKVSLKDDDETVKNFESLITENTKLVFCTAASNVCGKILPLEKIGEMCKRRGIAFGVDAAQMAGMLPIDTKKMNIDFLCIAPHKGLYAPMGIGVLIANIDIGDTIIEGGTGTSSQSPYQPEQLPERYESGTINVPSILGTSAGIDFIKIRSKYGYTNEMRHIQRIYTELEKMPHILLYTPFMLEYKYMPVLSFNLEGVASEKVAAYLNERGIAVRAGLHCAPSAHRKLKTIKSGTVRISPSIFTTQNEITYLLDILKYKNIQKKLLNER